MPKFAPTFEEHIHRYGFAMRYAYKKDVLDAGSKEGFGSQVLSWVAKSITLADIDETWLKDAERNSGYACPSSFILCDFNKEFPPGKWDTIIAFEVIEHVDDPNFFIKNMADALNPGGTLVFSVPHMVANREHKTLFDREGIEEAVGKHLKIKELYWQDKRYLTEDPMYKGLRCHVGVAIKE